MYITYKYKTINSGLDLETILSDINKIVTYSATPDPDNFYNTVFAKDMVDASKGLSTMCDKDFTLKTKTTITQTTNIDVNIPDYANSYIKVLPNWSNTTSMANTTTKIFVSSNDVNNDSTTIKNLEISVSAVKVPAKIDNTTVYGEIIMASYWVDDSDFHTYAYGNADKTNFIRPKLYKNGGHLYIFVENSHLFISSTNIDTLLWIPGLGCADFDPYILTYDNEHFGSYQSSGKYPKWVFMSMNGFDNIASPQCFDIVTNGDHAAIPPAPTTVTQPIKISKTANNAALKLINDISSLSSYNSKRIKLSEQSSWAWVPLTDILTRLTDIANTFKDAADTDRLLPNGTNAKQLSDIGQELKSLNRKDEAQTFIGIIWGSINKALIAPPVAPLPPDYTAPKQNIFQIKSPYLMTMKTPNSLNIPKYTINQNFKKAITCARVAIQNKYISDNKDNTKYAPLFYDIGGDISTVSPIYMIGVNCKSLDKLDIVLPDDDIVPSYLPVEGLDDNDKHKKDLYDTEFGLFTVWDSQPSKGTKIKSGSRIKYIVRLG